MIEFDIARLQLNDGDILVLKTRIPITLEIANRMREDMKGIFGERQKVLVLCNDIELSIIEPTKDAA